MECPVSIYFLFYYLPNNSISNLLRIELCKSLAGRETVSNRSAEK